MEYHVEFDGLSDLPFSYTRIHDISPLAALTRLTKLNLSNNQISDITPLASLQLLSKLNLSENHIDDVAPLAALLNLTRLELGDNAISNAAPLAHLEQLKVLNLSHNKIQSLPSSLLQLPLDWQLEKYGLDGLLLAGNPLQQPPPKIIKEGQQAIERYYRSLGSEG